MIKGIQTVLSEYNEVDKRGRELEYVLVQYFGRRVRKANKEETLIKILELAPPHLHEKILKY